MKLFSPPSKQKSMSLSNTVRSLSCGNLVYSVENSNAFIDYAAFLEFNPANLCLSPRRLEDIFKTSLEDILKRSSA